MTSSVGYILYGNHKIINAYFNIHQMSRVIGVLLYTMCVKKYQWKKCNFIVNLRMIAKRNSILGSLEQIAWLTLSVYWKFSYHTLKQKQ